MAGMPAIHRRRRTPSSCQPWGETIGVRCSNAIGTPARYARAKVSAITGPMSAALARRTTGGKIALDFGHLAHEYQGVSVRLVLVRVRMAGLWDGLIDDAVRMQFLDVRVVMAGEDDLHTVCHQQVVNRQPAPAGSPRREIERLGAFRPASPFIVAGEQRATAGSAELVVVATYQMMQKQELEGRGARLQR